MISDQKVSNILKTFGILITASLLSEILYKLGFGEQNINILMVLAVFIITTITDGCIYGLIAAVIGVFVYDLLYINPRMSFSITLGFPVTLIIMLIVAVTTNAVIGKIKNQLKLAQEKEHRAELLYDINRKFYSSRDEYTIARNATRCLTDNLNCTVALYTMSNNGNVLDYYIYQADNDITSDELQSDNIKNKVYNIVDEKRSVHSDSLYYMPIITQDNVVYGVFVISCNRISLSETHISLINILSDQTAQAIRVQRLTMRQQEIMIATETEKARNSFLRGISHDLRTPLTSIIGASTTFIESKPELPEDKQLQLIKGIQQDSQWLLSMVENILLITRIQENNLNIKKTEEVAEEVVSEAVALFRKRFPDIEITIQSTNELIFVPMDVLLITQLINNLLYNAQRHSGVYDLKISIIIQKRNSFAEFIVSDNGIGINPEILPDLFGTRHLKVGDIVDSSHGLGIGLSICKTIAEVHRGWIKALNLTDGGAQFIFAIPMEGYIDEK